MSVIDRLKKWRDKWYLTQDNDQGNTTQNGVRFTGHSVRSLIIKKEITAEEAGKIAGTVIACELEPGLLYRDPLGGGGQEGPDNTYANLYIDDVLETGFAKRWLKYGRTNGANRIENGVSFWHRVGYYILSLGGFKCVNYTYNTVNLRAWNGSAWLGRQLSLVAQAKWVAGEWMFFRFILKTWYIGGLIYSALDAESQDGKVLAWFTVMCIEPKINWYTSPFVKLAIWYWRRNLKQQWGGIGQVLNKYWNGNGHPDIEFLQNDLGEQV